MSNDNIVTLQNRSALLAVDLYGGAIVDFHLHDDINPLTFRFSKKQMPSNNKAGATYKGHFACIGRWGEPAAGEIKAGVPNHGEAANIMWQVKSMSSTRLIIEADCRKEGLYITRTVAIDKQAALFHVKETITNNNSLGRLYNIVQHPTIAAPFLSGATVINCNADKGFEYRNADNYRKYTSGFANVRDENNQRFDLSNPQQVYNSVFSFVIQRNDAFGWLTAWSPSRRLLLGYLWPRQQYPWISLWQHFENGTIKYRGLEFGTTGIHQSFKNIAEKNLLQVLGERTALYIDSGEKQTFEYACFLHKAIQPFARVKNVEVLDGEVCVMPANNAEKIFPGKIKFS